MKSNNQGFKEATFIQMGMRWGVAERRRDMVWCREATAVAEDRHGWSHINVWWIEIGRETLGASDHSPQSPGFQHHKDKSP